MTSAVLNPTLLALASLCATAQAAPAEAHWQAYDDDEPKGLFVLQVGPVRVSVPPHSSLLL